MRKELENKISVYGSRGEIEEAEKLLAKAHVSGNEHDDRLKIQQKVVPFTKASILYDGNTVWNKEKILKDIRRVLKNGMEKMSDYLYEFLHLSCGSIAHYNKQGWICTYPTVQSLGDFFKKNEFGKRVLADIPSWKSDAKVIVMEIEKELFLTKII